MLSTSFVTLKSKIQLCGAPVSDQGRTNMLTLYHETKKQEKPHETKVFKTLDVK